MNRKLWLINRATSLLPAPKLEAARLLDAAVRQEGLSDFGERDFDEGLDRLLRSLSEDARLSPMGRQALVRFVVRTLANRLRLVADRQRRPEVYATPLVPPILILGLPRAGTTFLHRLLSAMPGVRPARTWELNQPLPSPRGRDDRHAQASKQIAMIRKLMPELDTKHRLDPDDPDECVLLTMPSFRSVGWWMIAPVYGYLDWLMDQDMAPAYAMYHAYLKALQAAEPGRFVLKAPAHTAYLAELLAEIPELIVVHAHRDPVTVVASASSLFDSMFALVTEHHDSKRTARRNMALFADLSARCQAARDGGLDSRVLDLRYDDLVADPVATVQRIYAHGSIPWPEEAEFALRSHLGEGRRAKATHSYSLEAFGLSEAEVRAAFAAHIERYLS